MMKVKTKACDDVKCKQCALVDGQSTALKAPSYSMYNVHCVQSKAEMIAVWIKRSKNPKQNSAVGKSGCCSARKIGL
jgi:hypothetical protein